MRFQHGFIRVYVDVLRAVFNLLTCDRQGLVVFFFAYEAQEHLAAGHVGALAHVHKQRVCVDIQGRSEEHTSELQSLMRISYAVLCLKKNTKQNTTPPHQSTLSNTCSSTRPKQHHSST